MIDNEDIIILREIKRELENCKNFSFLEQKNLLNNLDLIILKLENKMYLKENDFNFFILNIKKIKEILSSRICNDFYFPENVSFFSRKEYIRLSCEINDSMEEFNRLLSLNDNRCFDCSMDFLIIEVLLYKIKIHFENFNKIKAISIF